MNRVELEHAILRVLQRIDPGELVADAVDRTNTSVRLGGAQFTLESTRPVTLIGIGKAAAAMVDGAAAVLAPISGIAVSDHESDCAVPLIVGDHPEPGERSRAATLEVLEVLAGTTADDVVCFLVSGGGSSLLEIPVPGMGGEALRSLHRALLRSGAPIEDINEVRAAYSTVKVGRLRDSANTERTATIVVSDVIGAGPEVVSSGPSIPSLLGVRALDLLDSHGIARPAVPPASQSRVGRPEPVTVVGSPPKAAEAMVAELSELGRTVVRSHQISGRVVDAVADLFGAPADADVVAAGEATVRVEGTGLGGRNQHAALIAAFEIEGSRDLFAAVGTDGCDGNTTAAGAIVDGGTIGRIRRAGLDPAGALAAFDSHSALAAAGDLLITGPTGTNVADLWIRIVSRGRPASR